MTKYHVSEDNRVRRCDANIRACRLIHGDTKEQAVFNSLTDELQGDLYGISLESKRKHIRHQPSMRQRMSRMRLQKQEEIEEKWKESPAVAVEELRMVHHEALLNTERRDRTAEKELKKRILAHDFGSPMKNLEKKLRVAFSNVKNSIYAHFNHQKTLNSNVFLAASTSGSLAVVGSIAAHAVSAPDAFVIIPTVLVVGALFSGMYLFGQAASSTASEKQSKVADKLKKLKKERKLREVK